MVTCTGHIGIHEGADGRTDVHDVMAIKRNFLTSMGYHIFLSMVLRARSSAMIMPSKCTTQAILNNRDPFTSRRRENAVFLAYVVNHYRAKLIISLTNQLQLEKEQTQLSVTCMIFSKTMELVKQMFTSMQTTVAARTKTIMSFGTGAGASFTVYTRA